MGACLPSLPGHGPDRGCPAPPIMSTSSVLDTPRLSSSRAGGCCRAGLWLRSGLDEVVHALLGRRAGSCLEPRVPLACGSSAYFAVVAATLCVGFVLVYHVVVLRVALHRLCSDVCMCLGKRAAVGCLRGCCCWYAGLAYVLCAACARGLGGPYSRWDIHFPLHAPLPTWWSKRRLFSFHSLPSVGGCELGAARRGETAAQVGPAASRKSRPHSC